MNTRTLWQQIMHYGQFNRMPVVHWTAWPETYESWCAEGVSPDVPPHGYFDAVGHWDWVNVDLALVPAFEEEVFAQTDEYRVFRGSDGAICKGWKHRSCIPHYVAFTLNAVAD